MSILPISSHHISFLFNNPSSKTSPLCFFPRTHLYSFSLLPPSPPPFNPRIRRSSFPSIRFATNFPDDLVEPIFPSKPRRGDTGDDDASDNAPPSTFVDEWGEKAEPEIEPSTRLSDADPPKDEDEWGQGIGVEVNGDGGISGGADKLWELKRCLVDTVYGSNFGFRTSTEVRAEALEFVSQLEAANPTPAPTESADLLDGNWVLLYTAFSELLPLLAAGTTPLLKVERICQSINTSSLTIENTATLSSPVSTLSFSASAAFEIRSPSRIQVEFKEGILKPPNIKSDIELPENVDIFGQKINLLPVQQALNPLQNAVAGVASAISGQPPLKIPIPGERTKSWLLITYLDKDLRISRGDGGLFVLAREGSSLLDQ